MDPALILRGDEVENTRGTRRLDAVLMERGLYETWGIQGVETLVFLAAGDHKGVMVRVGEGGVGGF